MIDVAPVVPFTSPTDPTESVKNPLVTTVRGCTSSYRRVPPVDESYKRTVAVVVPFCGVPVAVVRYPW